MSLCNFCACLKSAMGLGVRFHIVYHSLKCQGRLYIPVCMLSIRFDLLFFFMFVIRNIALLLEGFLLNLIQLMLGRSSCC